MKEGREDKLHGAAQAILFYFALNVHVIEDTTPVVVSFTYTIPLGSFSYDSFSINYLIRMNDQMKMFDSNQILDRV